MVEDCTSLEELYDWCLQSHYRKNDHHPEHFDSPCDMTEVSRAELTCDLLGSILGVFNKQSIRVGLSECRFVIESQKWKNWTYAAKEHLPESSNCAPLHDERWKKFPDEEKEKLNRLFQDFKRGITPLEVVKTELLKLDSVNFYLEDLQYHRDAVRQVWDQIPEFKSIPGMEDRINRHDDDKYETLMILGYTAKWCF